MNLNFKLPVFAIVKRLTKVLSQRTSYELKSGIAKMENAIARTQQNQQVALLRTDYLE